MRFPDAVHHFALHRIRETRPEIIYPSALAPAWAICSSSCDCTPETPMAPTHSFWCITGMPPWIRMPAGKPAKAGRSLIRSSKNLLGRLVMAEVLALPIDTSAEIAGAPSMRWNPNRKPPSSTTEIATAHLFLAASASQAAIIVFTSASVRHGLVRMGPPEMDGAY